MTQTLDLNKMGLEPLNNLEIIEVEGGGWLSEIVKAIVQDLVVDGVKALGQHVVNDWNSRSGGHRSMTDIHASNPYH